jgi:LmbE family N-acetylglucosaminyl deacetylase
MVSLNFVRQQPGRPFRILCLGAHSDDIEIGCGGLMLSLIGSLENAHVDWIVFSGNRQREREARQSAKLFLEGAARKRVVIHHFRDGFFPFEPRVKTAFEVLKTQVAPDLVLTHFRDDRHQDHRVLSDLAWNTFRDHVILEYEIPKYDGDFGSPNCFVALDRDICRRKIDYLEAAFGSQRGKDWFSAETFMGVMRLRGMECRAPDGYAEAFYARKLRIGI